MHASLRLHDQFGVATTIDEGDLLPDSPTHCAASSDGARVTPGAGLSHRRVRTQRVSHQRELQDEVVFDILERALRDCRADLVAAFPDPQGRDRVEWLAWLVAHHASDFALGQPYTALFRLALEQARREFAVLLTVQTMNYLHSGRHRVAL